MKILISAYTFYPNIGGIEVFTDTLATEFVKQGHEVIVITQTKETGERTFKYPVIRRPGPLKRMELIKWCDLYYQSNISLRSVWPLIFKKKPWVITHHIWILGPGDKLRLRDYLKHYLTRFARNISISSFIASKLKVHSDVISDPYNDSTFKVIDEVERDKDLVFVGRLVPEKGLDTAMHALYHLKGRGKHPTLTIIGSGPEKTKLTILAQRLGIMKQVTFHGIARDQKLATLLNEHKIMLVPSKWNEPFGIAALEGIASGCAVIGSEGGGLKETIGPCGMTFPNGNSKELANKIEKLIENPALLKSIQANRETHLKQFTAPTIAAEYLRVFQEEILMP